MWILVFIELKEQPLTSHRVTSKAKSSVVEQSAQLSTSSDLFDLLGNDFYFLHHVYTLISPFLVFCYLLLFLPYSSEEVVLSYKWTTILSLLLSKILRTYKKPSQDYFFAKCTEAQALTLTPNFNGKEGHIKVDFRVGVFDNHQGSKNW